MLATPRGGEACNTYGTELAELGEKCLSGEERNIQFHIQFCLGNTGVMTQKLCLHNEYNTCGLRWQAAGLGISRQRRVMRLLRAGSPSHRHGYYPLRGVARVPKPSRFQ